MKFGAPATAPDAHGASGDGRTRARITTLLLNHGSQSVAELAEALSLAPNGVRRHLDAMLAEGLVTETAGRAAGRGRPARRYGLTDIARDQLPHTYDDLAVAALRQLVAIGGREAVRAFADQQVHGLESRCRTAIDGAGDDPVARAEALAAALSGEGYAASAESLASGGQLCQRHCPVAQVAAEFPELCEAETEVIGRLVGSHVQRLATIARGDGVCTTHVPAGGVRAAHPPLERRIS
ncbi:helix-turn-helix transcriptional regulator [Cumulibacter manganitolerans]|uniref:helix-turn-helix transcriptional regulator n=1 Tax=Cumulibacter manganitolerans TaxID=1884992 RepID=UPI001E3A0F90|nr:metalloregulator ArsR/SmtB family transcription factor [Cumulibacter manganitolerans]